MFISLAEWCQGTRWTLLHPSPAAIRKVSHCFLKVTHQLLDSIVVPAESSSTALFSRKRPSSDRLVVSLFAPRATFSLAVLLRSLRSRSCDSSIDEKCCQKSALCTAAVPRAQVLSIQRQHLIFFQGSSNWRKHSERWLCQSTWVEIALAKRRKHNAKAFLMFFAQCQSNLSRAKRTLLLPKMKEKGLSASPPPFS